MSTRTYFTKDHKYIPLSSKEKFELLQSIHASFKRFVTVVKYDISKLSCRVEVLYDILERVEMRKAYFHVFYDGKVMSEQNEMSLFCFWILKLSPFFDAAQRNKDINATFAVYMFLDMLTRVNSARKRKTVFNSDYVNNLRYAFVYRDISKEAIMLAADTFLSWPPTVASSNTICPPPTPNNALAQIGGSK